MPVLHTQLRNRLEAAVKQARRTAEAAAKVAVERLTVGSAEPGSHLNVEERQLRNRLRAHGRQLGDGRDSTTGTQSIDRLKHECAYEHWHRMLFARFLAENHLLIHEKVGMPVTLAECDELAVDEGALDGWTLAARYAARMLPQIFRPDDPVLQVGFAPEHKRALEKLVTELPVDVFTAEDSLGWVYQFWQAERKDEVNASGDKITGETLPAVTQLFTEHYMVLFLLHNTIGAWWAARLKAEGSVPKSEWDKCRTEDDCRKLLALPGYEFTYLRFIKDGNGDWVPAAGSFPGWPKALKDFKLLDPCCGSGHFLVAAFVLLAQLRMRDEKLSAKDACDAVLRDNLHGLELDPRCTQIAAFALALTAWKFTDGFRPLPPLNIACSGLGVNARKEDWLALANDDTRLRSGLEQLYDLFQKAPELGSLINPRQLAHGDLLTASFTEIQPLLTKAIQSETARKNDDLSEIGVAAQGMASAAHMVGGHFHLVVTNVPYLGRVKQGRVLRDYCETWFPKSRADLATCFIERGLDLCAEAGAVAAVTPQNWLFSATYKNLRRQLLGAMEWRVAVKLGENGFESTQAAGAFTALVCLAHKPPSPNQVIAGLDLHSEQTPLEKAAALVKNHVTLLSQHEQLSNPDCIITAESLSQRTLLQDFAVSIEGTSTGDGERFLHTFCEIGPKDDGWEPFQGSPDGDGEKSYDGLQMLVRWDNGKGELAKFDGARIRGQTAWGKCSVVVGQMRVLKTALTCGFKHDKITAVLLPKNPQNLPAIWAFCSSPTYNAEVRKLSSRINAATGILAKVPFDLAYWERVAREKYPQGLPSPDSNDPTQWLFNGRLPQSTAPLQVGLARLLGYRWPRQNGQAVSGAPPMPEDGLEKFTDEDGIVCIPSVRGEAPAAERLRALLAAAYGKSWSSAMTDELLGAVDYAGSNLEDWLCNGFFDQHSKLFHHRPFIWQIWDGRKDGFSALINYHKFDHKLLEKLTYTYLGEWIKKQQEAVANGEGGADDRLVKAQQLQDKLKLILEGEGYPDPDPEKSWGYDIFVRWKPKEQQPIGWHPDLNDGVRLNIRPFMEADVLRKRPNIKWGIDRGKNPPGSPWGEERDNDRHLTLAEKREARNG